MCRNSKQPQMTKTKNCEQCWKFHHQTVSGHCSFCSDYAFSESILCDLTRSAQNCITGIECSAFKPRLQSANGSIPESEEIESDDSVEFSDRQKWLRAYALQQLEFDPDQIISNLNFHACLVTTKRIQVDQIEAQIQGFASAFNKSDGSPDTQLTYLCSGNDHVHFHINSSPDHAPDTIIDTIVENLNQSLKAKFPSLRNETGVVFESFYFIESL